MGRGRDHSLNATTEYQGHCYRPQIPLATAHAALLLPLGTGWLPSPHCCRGPGGWARGAPRWSLSLSLEQVGQSACGLLHREPGE